MARAATGYSAYTMRQASLCEDRDGHSSQAPSNAVQARPAGA